MEPKKLTVQATIQADRKKVWDYWTMPEHITQWNFAADTWECPTASNDLRIGGKYAARMQAKDGSFGFDFEAEYTEVADQERLTYVMGDGRVATTDFEDLGGTTKVTTVFDAEGQNDPEFQRAGWQAIMDNFKKHVESA